MLDRQNLLEIQNLSISYSVVGQRVLAVDSVSLKLTKGEALGIIGESGCGKSSLALGIMGLLDKAELSGKVLYKGQNLLELNERKLKKYRWVDMAVVFQNSLEVLNPVLTIKEQIRDVIKTHYALSREEIEQKILGIFQMLDLNAKWLNEYPHQLSGGMRQKVLIAMALACDPELLIVDEPTTSLDPLSKNEVIVLLNKLKKKMGFTMIVISHDMEVIKKLSSRLITMYQGRFLELGFTEEVIRDPGHCYTRGLLNSSPELFEYKDLWGIKGRVEENNSKGCIFYPRCPQREQSCQDKKPELKYIAVERMVACHKGGIETLLRADRLKKSYQLTDHSSLEALKGVDLEVKSGEVVALVGVSGSGKSTLAHLLTGIIPLDSGEIVFLGRELKGRWATKMIGGMQLVFQDPFAATSARLSVLEVVREPLDIIGWQDTFAREKKAVKLLKEVELPVTAAFLNRPCRNLSGGQRQRIAIARSMVTEPSLLIADEITSMLDPSIQANILRKLKGLQNSQGFSMLYITHNFKLARKLADRVYVLQEGKIVEKGISSEVLSKAADVYHQQLCQ
ncbi:MAG: ABC transporter ATP-binding protein [Firmicutes bacterium]|nr:ABC transporter ATP-binding protein [Bacillota bacterium]